MMALLLLLLMTGSPSLASGSACEDDTQCLEYETCRPGPVGGQCVDWDEVTVGCSGGGLGKRVGGRKRQSYVHGKPTFQVNVNTVVNSLVVYIVER